MTLVDLFNQVPPERRDEIVLDSANHVFYAGREWVLTDSGELKLIGNHRQVIALIAKKLGIPLGDIQ